MWQNVFYLQLIKTTRREPTMSSIKFSTTSSVEGKITTTVHTTMWFDTIKDEYHNEIATIISSPRKVKVSSVTKQLEGCKHYVYVNKDTGVPVGMEHEDYGEIGGLWFKGKTLVDFDGCGCLPKAIVKTIRALGYHVPRDME